MPKFTVKWFIERVFDEFEPRDFLVMIVVGGIFAAIMYDKIPTEHCTALITGVVGYALGRPNSGGNGK